ncbi:hypothetical protein LXA43DRAFT_1063020 [Ganoderma leucocontextum]|nr:hypothetical protein LXA43DRAFT_1063020 [Ganoderma leucocontextum]
MRYDTAFFKYTCMAENTLICKDDLVSIPPNFTRAFAIISPLPLCCTPFDALVTSTDLVKFTVFNVDPLGAHGASGLPTCSPAAVTTRAIMVRTRLGGDSLSAVGYFLTNAKFNLNIFVGLLANSAQGVVLMGKAYPNRCKKKRPRVWTLWNMAKEFQRAQYREDKLSTTVMIHTIIDSRQLEGNTRGRVIRRSSDPASHRRVYRLLGHTGANIQRAFGLSIDVLTHRKVFNTPQFNSSCNLEMFQ